MRELAVTMAVLGARRAKRCEDEAACRFIHTLRDLSDRDKCPSF
jgi:hypothetical protein